MRIARLTALALVAVGLALAAAACGEEGPQIPRDEARNIVRRLQEADRRLSQDPPVCGDLSEDSIPALEDQVASLPEETDDAIKDTMRDGIDHLRSLIEAECASREEEPDTETTTEEEAPTTTEEEPPPTTEPPDTETEPPDPETEPPDTETTPSPPGNGSGGQGPPEGGAVAPKLKRKKDKD